MLDFTHNSGNVDEISILGEQISENEKAGQYPVLAVLWVFCHAQTLWAEDRLLVTG